MSNKFFPTREELRRLAESFGAKSSWAEGQATLQMTLAEMEKLAEYFIVQGQKLAMPELELTGVLVCHKRIPNALQEFVPIRFYREEDWGPEYSKVQVFAKPRS